MKVNWGNSPESIRRTLYKWLDKVATAGEVGGALINCLSDVEEIPGAKVGLNVTVIGNLSITVTGLSAFDDMSELLEAIPPVVGTFSSSYDMPDELRRTWHFPKIVVHGILRSDTEECLVLRDGEKTVERVMQPKLRFVCKGSPEYDEALKQRRAEGGLKE